MIHPDPQTHLPTSALPISDLPTWRSIIESYWEKRNTITPHNAPEDLKSVLQLIITQLEAGHLRVASCQKISLESHQEINETQTIQKSPQKTDSPSQKQATETQTKWHINTWVKQAILLYFRSYDNQLMQGTINNYFDKIPLRFQNDTITDFQQLKIRVVPPGCVRKGAYIAPQVVLMPSYVNIGAYVGEGSMIDTWATIGSCAQIGKQVHISGGVGIGGVLEPLQANPTIIEDNCFIGARSEIVEGVIVEKNSVISMGVFIGQSTKIYDREADQILYGKIPAGSVVVPGSLPSLNGRYNLSCAIIVKKVDEKTRAKTSINQLLRDVL